MLIKNKKSFQVHKWLDAYTQLKLNKRQMFQSGIHINDESMTLETINTGTDHRCVINNNWKQGWLLNEHMLNEWNYIDTHPAVYQDTICSDLVVLCLHVDNKNFYIGVVFSDEKCTSSWLIIAANVRLLSS